MEHIIKFMCCGKDVEFYCDSRDTRNGFAHDSRMYVNGRQISIGHCYYLNRTWEHYRFQNVCLTACSNRLEVLEGDLKDDFKDAMGIKCVVGDRLKRELKAYTDADSEVIFLRRVKEILHERSF